jgi:hypothetical protein
MGQADECRKRAEVAEKAAASTSYTDLQQGFLDLAKQWRDLADQIDARARPKG